MDMGTATEDGEWKWKIASAGKSEDNPGKSFFTPIDHHPEVIFTGRREFLGKVEINSKSQNKLVVIVPGRSVMSY